MAEPFDDMHSSPELRETKRLHRRSGATATLAARLIEHFTAEGLSPGAHLRAQDLADRFEVSRSPVNAALKLLHSKGVIEHRAHQGYFVAETSIKRAEDAGLTTTDPLSATYFQIAEDRLAGRLPDQVSETLLQRNYKLTRTSVAEMLRRIAEEGWIERRTGYGWVFTPVLTTQEALEQSYHLRLAIEPAAIMAPSFKWDPRQSQTLRAVETQLLDGALETVSNAELYDRGVRFHETIVAASQNPFLLDALRRVNRVRRLLVYRSMNERGRYYAQAREHLAILDLLDQGSYQEAAEMLRQHLTAVVQRHQEIPGLFQQ